MPLQRRNTGNPIRGRITPNASQRAACQTATNMLDHADLGRGAGTLHTSGAARIDMQGRTAAGDANVQVQVGGSTAILSSRALQERDPRNRVGVRNAVVSVLNQSMDTGTVRDLQGSVT